VLRRHDQLQPQGLLRVACCGVVETGPPTLSQVSEIVKFETGNLAMISGGKNTGRIGVIVSRERHQGSFDIVHLKDSAGHMFATRLGNVFVIGQGNRPMVSLPKRKGIKMTILEERALRPPKN
jgi:small subunit ribosomal protein S4e